MSLTQADREYIFAIVREAVKEASLEFYREMDRRLQEHEKTISKQHELLIEQKVDTALKQHAETCPNVSAFRRIITGVIIGIVLAGILEGIVRASNGFFMEILKWL